MMKIRLAVMERLKKIVPGNRNRPQWRFSQTIKIVDGTILKSMVIVRRRIGIVATLKVISYPERWSGELA